MPFPNSPAPSYNRTAKWTDAGSKRNGIHYVGDAVSITLNAALADDITYEVRDYYGTVISSGAVAAGESTFTPTSPGGGWSPGWYRVYLIGTQLDANFGYSCGATNFCVIRDDPHFVPMPAGNTVGGHLSESPDFVAKGVLGMGTSRLQIDYANDYETGENTLTFCQSDAALTSTYWVDPGAPYADAARPRYAWCQFPNGGYDELTVWGSSYILGWFLCKDETIDGSQVWVEIVAGSVSGQKVNIYSPDSGTLAESHDNLGDLNAVTAAFAASAYVRFYRYSGWPFDLLPKTAIGRDKFNGVAAIVADLYPRGVTRYEGPRNEPLASGIGLGYVANAMRLFQAAVHAGNASAKAIGPCYVVTYQIPGGQGWDDFFSHNGADYCDEISFHAYGSVANGDVNQGRHTFQDFQALLGTYSVSKPLWQTESTHIFTSVYGVYHPRRSRAVLVQVLLMEQFGIPREQNNFWYDTSHGFWGYPAWWEEGVGQVAPLAVLYRVLAEETWGKPYASALDFGTLGNAIFCGNVYVGAAGKAVALVATSYIPDASVTLEISGSSDPVTVVDGFGNESTVPLSGGRVTVPMTDVPSYVRLPSAASATVHHVNDWDPAELSAVSLSPSASTKEIDGVTYAEIADGAYMTRFDAGEGIVPPTWAVPPSDSTLLWGASQTVTRVLVWCGPCWQTSGTLIDFDVQTYDGAGWTTRKTITKPSGDYFQFGTDAYNEGCTYETFWDEQWVFDVKLPGPVTCTGVRLHVREASYGGEPLPASGFGQGNSEQGYRLQEIAVLDVSSGAEPELVGEVMI